MISDCNFHLPTLPEPIDLQLVKNKALLDKAIDVEFNICKYGIKKTLDAAFKKADSLGLSLVNFMILDSDFAKNLCNIDFNIELKEGHYLTVLIDPYDESAAKHIESAYQQGISGVKFHPYLQKIHEETYSKIQELAMIAQSKNMWVAIDCSYGTDLLYKVNGVDLCAYLLNSGYTGKLLSLHFGGPRIFDVMSLMAQHTNIYADLSLSLSYWKGSSVWDDLNFAISRVGYSRFIFGSDQPFIQFDKAVTDFEDFSTKYGITTEVCESIKHRNFYEFLSKT
jgi:hypothetical protein